MLGRNGSSCLDLFLDFVDEQRMYIFAQRSIAQQTLIDQNFEWNDADSDEITKQNIEKVLENDRKFDKVDKEDISLIVDGLIKQRNEKIQQKLQMSVGYWSKRSTIFGYFCKGHIQKPVSPSLVRGI